MDTFLSYVLLVLLVITGCDSSTSQEIPADDDPLPQENLSLPITGTSAVCSDGLADDIFPCSNVDLLARIEPDQLMGDRLNDIWGWTDPQTEVEYALVGMNDGVTFVDLSTPGEPRIVGKLQESVTVNPKKLNQKDLLGCGIGFMQAAGFSGAGSAWRDFKVYQDHLYVVSDGQDHGMQVFDLTRLREVSEGDRIKIFEQDSNYDQVDNAHNISINEETGFGFIVGATNASVCGEGGLHIVDLNNPGSPEFAGCFAETSVEAISAPGYVHDTQCVIYDGPDPDYSGQEVCFNASETALVIANVNDKENPQTVSVRSYEDVSYAHQGWLSEDRNFYLLNDELDESGMGFNTRTYIWDVRNLDDPKLTGIHEFTTQNIDHNLYVKGNHVYEANYTNGLRILELEDLQNANLSETAFFDTYPENDFTMFDGAWSSYPFFESGVIVVSDISGGLFVLSPGL